MFNQIELERQAVELREFLIYHTDPALGAVWSRYEQEFARLAKKHDERQQMIDRLQNNALILGAAFLVVLEIWALMYLIHLNRDM